MNSRRDKFNQRKIQQYQNSAGSTNERINPLIESLSEYYPVDSLRWFQRAFLQMPIQVAIRIKVRLGFDTYQHKDALPERSTGEMLIKNFNQTAPLKLV